MRIPSITMLYEKTKKVNEIRGSSLLSPTHGRVGARAISLSFCISVPPPSEKIAGSFQQAGKKEGGWGEGIFARLPKRSPAALLVQSRTQQKSFLFLLEEKRGGARKSKIEKKTFLLAGER